MANNYTIIAEETIPIIEALDDLKFKGLRIVSSTSELAFTQAEEAALTAEDTAHLEEHDHGHGHDHAHDINEDVAHFRGALQVYHDLQEEHEDVHSDDGHDHGDGNEAEDLPAVGTVNQGCL